MDRSYQKLAGVRSSLSRALSEAQEKQVLLDKASLEAYTEAYRDYIQDLIDTAELEKARFAQSRITKETLAADILSIFGKLPELSNFVLSGKATALYKQVSDAYLGMDYTDPNYLKARTIWRDLSTYIAHASEPMKTPKQVQAEIDGTLEPRMKALTRSTYTLIGVIKRLIRSIPNWMGSTVFVRLAKFDSDVHDFEKPLSPRLTIFVSAKPHISPSSPSFSLWANEPTKPEDVLDAGDSEFFHDLETASDYFSLVAELTSPGASKKPGRLLTLYTARPIEDRELYTRRKELPPNIFLASDLSHVRGLAMDLNTKRGRDVWKVKIDSKHVFKTLEGPTSYYQVVSTKPVPVKSMVLVDTWEA